MEVFQLSSFGREEERREYKAGRFTYVSNAVLSPPPGTDTTPGRRSLAQ